MGYFLSIKSLFFERIIGELLEHKRRFLSAKWALVCLVVCENASEYVGGQGLVHNGEGGTLKVAKLYICCS